MTPEIDVTPDQALKLIRGRLQEVSASDIEPLGSGWDNNAYLVDGRFVFRFPRRKIAVDLIRIETRALPILAPHLPVAIPSPKWIGEPDGEYPWPFSGYEVIPGRTACGVSWTSRQRDSVAVPLARFLAALHGIPVSLSDRDWAPPDTIGRTDLARRVEMMEGRITRVEQRLTHMGYSAAEVLQAAYILAETPPSAAATSWVHGDLYPRHLLVDKNRCLCGVIDWGDVHLGDRALDLSIAFTFLTAAGRSAFREAYGEIDADTWERARFRALNYAIILLDYGADVNDESLIKVGEFALSNVMR